MNGSTTTAPPSTPAPPPGIEVWELKRDVYRDSASTKGLVWERILPEQQQNPPRRNFDKGRSFYFGAQGKKPRKISKRLLTAGDCTLYLVSDPLGTIEAFSLEPQP